MPPAVSSFFSRLLLHVCVHRCLWAKLFVFCFAGFPGLLLGQNPPANTPSLFAIIGENGVLGDRTVEFGQRVVLGAIDSSIVIQPTPYTWRWSRNGVTIPGATGNQYVIAAATAADAGTYTVTLSNNVGSSSVSAVVTVKPSTGIVFTRHPVSAALVVGESVGFDFSVTGSFPRTYQWRKNGAPISGATGEKFTVEAVTGSSAGDYSVVVSNSLGPVESKPATLSVGAAIPISILVQPKSLVINKGQQVYFEVVTSGSGPATFQWFKDGKALQEQANGTSIYALRSAEIADAGVYTVKIANVLGSVMSEGAYLTVNEAILPSITTQPVSQTVAVGATVSLSVQVTGSTPLSYQWHKNRVPISGATNSTITITNAQSSDSGSYIATVTNSVGSASSKEVVVTVARPPVVDGIGQRGQTVLIGETAFFSVTATGTSPITYQWRRDGVSVSGATGNSLTLRGVQVADAGNYTVEVSSPGGTVISSSWPLVVVGPNSPPAISRQPESADIAAGSTLLTVNAVSSTPPSYQWYRDGIPVSGETTPLMLVRSPLIGVYTVRITNSSGSVISSPALVTISGPAVIVAAPSSQTLVRGETVWFTVVAAGTGPLAYQWAKDGVPISGATGSSFTIASVQPVSAGAYTVVVSNFARSVVSTAATLTVTTPTSLPLIISDPSNQITTVGGSVFFEVNAASASPLSYQWRKDGVAISGATNSTFSLSNVQSTAAGNYMVVVSNSGGSVNSQSASLTVSSMPLLNTPPIISSQPSSRTAIVGAAVTLNVVATGSTPLSYQWNKNGVPIIDATTPEFILGNIQAEDMGRYTVVVSNAAGTASSTAATLTVTAAPPPPTVPAITSLPAAQFITAGQSANFSVVATGTAPLAYQWLRNGIPIPASTAATHTIASVQVTDAGSYTVVVTNSVGSVTSSAAVLTVNAPNYAGTYFGRFNNNPGDRFALVIRADGTALFLGYAASLFTGYTATNIVIQPDGTFTADLTEIKPPAANSPAGDALPGAIDPPSLAAAPLTLSGSVASGQLTGGVTGAALTLAAPKSPATGSAQSSAGVYQTSALNSSTGGLTTIVDATGAAFVFSQTTAGVAAGTGTLNTSTGQVTAVLADNSQATTTLNPGSGSATASVTTTSKETLSFAGLAEGTLRTDRLVNIASRGAVSASELMIAGFVITGTTPKPVMIRATGPALAAFGLGGTLPNPKLELYRGAAKIQENDDWSAAANATEVVATAARTGAFPLTAASADAVLLTTLEPGGYTAQVSSVTGSSGVALVEVYDAGSTAVTVRYSEAYQHLHPRQRRRWRRPLDRRHRDHGQLSKENPDPRHRPCARGLRRARRSHRSVAQTLQRRRRSPPKRQLVRLRRRSRPHHRCRHRDRCFRRSHPAPKTPRCLLPWSPAPTPPKSAASRARQARRWSKFTRCREGALPGSSLRQPGFPVLREGFDVGLVHRNQRGVRDRSAAETFLSSSLLISVSTASWP